MRKFKKGWFGPFKVEYCLSKNIVFLVSVNNFEPNLILCNVNKLKPYRYVDQKLKGIHSSKYQKSLKSIDTDQIFTSKEVLVNLMSQQVMILFRNHCYTILQLVDYRLDFSVTLEQNFVDLMIQHKTKEIYNVNNTRSS